MSTVVTMNGKTYVEPGSYAITVYQPTSVVNVASFGRVMIIDTGLSQEKAGDATYEFAGGAGIAGVDASGRKAIYAFENFEDFSDFMGGGMITDLAQKLFTPIDGSLGTPRLRSLRNGIGSEQIGLTLAASHEHKLVKLGVVLQEREQFTVRRSLGSINHAVVRTKEECNIQLADSLQHIRIVRILTLRALVRSRATGKRRRFHNFDGRCTYKR